MPSVLIVGYDPHSIPDSDAEALLKQLDQEMARFEGLGISATAALVTADESTEPALVAQLADRPWDVVVIGAGVRTPEPALVQFERIVNLVRRYAPQAAVAFNTGPDTSVEAAQRWI
ncbi:SGNH/GDSL hydrolase family protein [Streptomyces paludis]|uniref:Uncharacterized protein n=1 Tax=Streptomyces paludis TaxID=2282738 RepID=A0A345HN18_9ACTN|nr:hypothetical protein [Streptomyces paludis]AXG78092.1 hypothetical protein DVK44_10670 [Streptomyces paludis]